MGGGPTLIGKEPPDVSLTKLIDAFMDHIKDVAYEAAMLDAGGFYTGPPFAKGVQPPRPAGFQPINLDGLPRELRVKLRENADAMLAMGYPVGSRTEAEIDGKRYKFFAEWHQHPPTDDVSPALKEVHRGISIYEAKP